MYIIKNLPRYLLLIGAILSFAWGLPHLYNMAAKKKVQRPYASYSAVLGDFLFIKSGEGRPFYFDASGKQYSQKEYEKLLPFMYATDLRKWGEYPDSVGGVAVPFEKALNERDMLRVSPHFVDLGTVRIQLFPLFEAESDFTSLEMPKELFGINKRMEFINASANKINEEKSALFTEALKSAGFAFPAKIIAGNTNPRKPYDFGYFVLDSKDELFHIYQAASLPKVKKTGIALESGIQWINVRENKYLPYYGLIAANNGEVYQILNDGYSLFKLDVRDYNPLTQSLLYSFDPLHIAFKVIDESGETMRVTTREGEFVKEHRTDTGRNLRAAGLYDILFPFVLKANPYKYGGYIIPVISKNYLGAFILSAILTALYGIFLVKRKRALPPVDLILILAGGIYSLSAILLLEGVS
jgi:hypothetical protein